MSSKRKKNDSSDEESDEVDWQRKYRKKSKEFGKKMMRLRESQEECNMKRGELHEMSLKNDKLEFRLKRGNGTLLRSQSMLNVRGVIEFLEGEQEMPDSVRQSDRHDRWEWIFDNDSKFSNEVRSYLPRSTAQRVAKIVDEILHKAAANAPSLWLSKLVISGRSYTADEQNVIKAICATIPCNFSIE